LRHVPNDGEVIGSIGCGMGATEHALVKQGRKIHGVDISSEAIAVARTRLTSARVIKPDEKQPFPEESLDGLILADVLEHLPDAKERLSEFVRTVRRGGWVLISVPNMRYIDALWTFVIGGDWPERNDGIFDNTHIQVMTHKRIARWCIGAGLEIEKWAGSINSRGWRRDKYRRWFNKVTFRIFEPLFHYQIQILCRKKGNDS
jgi:2-polyprenyl-3-methyl-5-hydroxy-6-metoxy-1,4-benzoquinol methylase